MNAFVTGGSRGIGRAVVERLVAAGHDCAFTYQHRAEAAEETVRCARALRPEAKVVAYQLDVTDPAAVDAVVERAIEEFGEISVVVNNAGIVRNNAAVLMTNEEWSDVLATNLSGAFFVTRAFLMHLVGQRFGRIISISSIAQDGLSGQANYAASKAGLVGLMRTIAKEYGPKGITANVVAPGFIKTDMTAEHAADAAESFWLKFCPARRVGQADDVAHVVAFLASRESGFVSGEVIRAAGGLSEAP